METIQDKRTVATLDLITGNKGDGTEQKRSVHEYR